MIPFRIIEMVGNKSGDVFKTFCKILTKFDCEVASIRLQSAYRAKCGVDPDIRREADVIKEHLRGSTISDRNQDNMTQAVAEKLQTERCSWQEKIERMQTRLDILQKRLKSVCSMLQGAITKSKEAMGTDAHCGTGKVPVSPSIGQIQDYTTEFVGLIKDLKNDNDILANEATVLRNKNEDVLKRMKQLERVKKRQNEQLKEVHTQLGECKMALSSLEAEIIKRDVKKSGEIQDLIIRLDCKSEEINQLIADKDYLVLQVQSLNLKIDDIEDSQETLKTQTNENMQNLEIQLNDAQNNLQQQIKELTNSMRSTQHVESSKHKKSVPLQHDHGHIVPTNQNPYSKAKQRLPSKKKTDLSLKRGAHIPEVNDVVYGDSSVRGDLSDRSTSNPLPPIEKEIPVKKHVTAKAGKRVTAKVRK